MTDYELTLMNEAPKKIWMMENPQAWATRDDMFNTPYIRADIVDELVKALKNTTAHLVAAHSLLQGGGKKAAASNAMFEIMLNDYEKSIEVGRAALAKARGELNE